MDQFATRFFDPDQAHKLRNIMSDIDIHLWCDQQKAFVTRLPCDSTFNEAQKQPILKSIEDFRDDLIKRFEIRNKTRIVAQKAEILKEMIAEEDEILAIQQSEMEEAKKQAADSQVKLDLAVRNLQNNTDEVCRLEREHHTLQEAKARLSKETDRRERCLDKDIETAREQLARMTAYFDSDVSLRTRKERHAKLENLKDKCAEQNEQVAEAEKQIEELKSELTGRKELPFHEFCIRFSKLNLKIASVNEKYTSIKPQYSAILAHRLLQSQSQNLSQSMSVTPEENVSVTKLPSKTSQSPQQADTSVVDPPPSSSLDVRKAKYSALSKYVDQQAMRVSPQSSQPHSQESSHPVVSVDDFSIDEAPVEIPIGVNGSQDGSDEGRESEGIISDYEVQSVTDDVIPVVVDEGDATMDESERVEREESQSNGSEMRTLSMSSQPAYQSVSAGFETSGQEAPDNEENEEDNGDFDHHEEQEERGEDEEMREDEMEGREGEDMQQMDTSGYVEQEQVEQSFVVDEANGSQDQGEHDYVEEVEHGEQEEIMERADEADVTGEVIEGEGREEDEMHNPDHQGSFNISFSAAADGMQGHGGEEGGEGNSLFDFGNTGDPNASGFVLEFGGENQEEEGREKNPGFENDSMAGLFNAMGGGGGDSTGDAEASDFFVTGSQKTKKKTSENPDVDTEAVLNMSGASDAGQSFLEFMTQKNNSGSAEKDAGEQFNFMEFVGETGSGSEATAATTDNPFNFDFSGADAGAAAGGDFSFNLDFS